MNHVAHTLLLSLLLLCGPLGAWAQVAPPAMPDSVKGQALQPDTFRLNIRGTVYENQSLHPMEGAAVKLFDASGTMKAGCMTQKNGQFALQAVPAGTYTMKVSFMGFKEQSFSLDLPRKNGNFRVSDVMMREDATLMQEAVVEGKLPEMTVVDDTVMYNADAFKVEDGAMVEELIKKLPGIVVDENGNFVWNGKEVSQILVDGKEFFGGNRQLVLKNLPAEIVEKVKAYDRKSDHARITGIDDGNERTVLDLTVKKNRKRGFFGNGEGASGTHDRYNSHLNLNRFKGDTKYSGFAGAGNTGSGGKTDEQRIGATMNWENKRLELNGSANANFRQQESESRSNSQNFEAKRAAYTNNHNWSGSTAGTFGAQYKVEWKPDSTWNILLRPEVSYSNSRSWGGSEAASFSANPYLHTPTPLEAFADIPRTDKVNHRRAANHSTTDRINLSANLQVNKRLGKRGRNLTLGMTAGYSNDENESVNYSQTDYYQIVAQSGGDSIYHKVQYSTRPQKSYNWSARISYNEPLAEKVYLQLSYNYSYSFRDNNRDVRSIFDPFNDMLGVGPHNYDLFFDSPYAERDAQQCSYTRNRYQNHDLRLQLRINRTRYQLTVGGNVQPQVSHVDYHKGRIDAKLSRTVANVAPTLTFRYKFSRQEQLDMRYNASTAQPNIIDMVPDTLSDANPLNIRIGNAELKPSFTQHLDFNYRRAVPDLQRTTSCNLQFHTTRNSTTSRTEYNELTGGRVSMPVNVNGNWNGSANIDFNTALGERKDWHVGTNTSAGMTNALGYQYRNKKKETLLTRTRSGNIAERLRLTYRHEWASEWRVEANLHGSFRYNISRSTNETASNLDHHNFNYGGSTVITTPWGMTLSTDISQQCRRGFSDAAMNTNQLIWNASLSQRLLKNRALTLSLRAIDILAQRDDVSRSISATSRTDTQNDIVRSYVMFSANLRFGKFGGRRGGEARRGGDGEPRRGGDGDSRRGGGGPGRARQ